MDLVAKVKTMPGRRWNGDDKVWEIPGDDADALWRLSLMIQPEIEPELEEWIKSSRIKSAEAMTTPLPDDAELHIPWATRRAKWQPKEIIIAGEAEPFQGLMKHQRPAVALAAEKRRILICDDMGGGKSATAISAIQEYIERAPLDEPRPEGPRLIICPNSVKGSWENELELWLGKDCNYQLIDAATPKKRHEQLTQAIIDKAWTIVNWEQIRCKKQRVEIERRDGSKTKKVMWLMKEPLFMLPNIAPLGLSLDDLDWKTVEKLAKDKDNHKGWLANIADEIHRAKNRNAQTAQGLWRIQADGMMLGLSGTPMMNNPAELWSVLAWLWPHDYHERGAAFSPGARAYWSFFEEYVEYEEGYFGKIITGVRNPDALRFELSGRLIRRTKRMMKLGTKGKKRIAVPLQLNKGQRKLYDEATTAMWLEVAQAAEEGDKTAKAFAKAALDGDAKRMMRVPNGASRTVRLRQIIETPACLGGDDDSAVLDAAVDKIIDSAPEQWVVYTEFVPTVKCFADRLNRNKDFKATLHEGEEGVAVYHGDVDPEERRDIAKRFQAGTLRVIVGTMKSMREGITLTAGANQYWCSRDWVPDNNEQGEDRQDRIGQTRQVLVWIAQPKDTVAVDKVEPINRLKERIVRTVLPKDEIEEGDS
jgi:SNF2 family DNA or RNA helicase